VFEKSPKFYTCIHFAALKVRVVVRLLTLTLNLTLILIKGRWRELESAAYLLPEQHYRHFEFTRGTKPKPESESDQYALQDPNQNPNPNPHWRLWTNMAVGVSFSRPQPPYMARPRHHTMRRVTPILTLILTLT